ncbi:hypothetical protein DFH94DRAFT_757248, partial [Russula ochroleuca]
MRPDLPAIRGVTFGTRQVGSAAWATSFDSQITQLTRVNNKRDPVPTVPGRLLGSGTHWHPRGEIHLESDLTTAYSSVR